MVKVYYDADCNLDLLKGKTVAIIGFGSQGHAHAQNLHDSGIDVVVGLRPGSKSRAKAEEAGLKVMDTADAAKAGDVVMILAPDQNQPDIYEKDIKPNLEPGNMLMFAHGFSIHFKQIVAPEGVDVTMCAPKGPGHTVRSQYLEGKGVPQNYGKAVNLLNAAGRQGHLDAMMTLGRILAEGRKYKRDVYTAHILFNLSSVRGAEQAAEFRDRLSKEMEIDMVLRAQTQADAFRPQPSELTSYIHQTFGENIKAYIDRYLPKPENKPKTEKETPKKESNNVLL